MVVSIEDAISACWEIHGRESNLSAQMHHISMLITLEFLRDCGFNNVSLEEPEIANKR
jgi:hypothetical protein